MGAVEWTFVVLAGMPALVALVALVTTIVGMGSLRRLADVDPGARDDWPSLSIVVPACNEEATVGAAINTMLRQDYSQLDLVVVNDRSTDRTPEILDSLAADDPRLTVVHLDELPDGWLGKLHALSRGVERTTGEWLLFADADAHLGPSTLRKAVAHAEAEGLDLLSVFPRIESAGFFGDAVFAITHATFAAATQLWNVGKPGSSAIAATGAFILVRRAAFERTPGFGWIRLEVADDFGLCLMIREHDGRIGIVNGAGELSIVWYTSYDQMARLVQKNLYAILGRFSIPRIAFHTIILSWMGLFPLALLLPLSVPALYTLVPVGLVLWMAAMVVGCAYTRRPWVAGLFPPVGFLVMAWLMVRSGWIGVRVGGIVWRGVRYPTELLAKHQRVRF